VTASGVVSLVSCKSEHAHKSFAYALIVVHYQHIRFSWTPLFILINCCQNRLAYRQCDSESRPFAHTAIDFNMAAVALNNAVADSETQTGSHYSLVVKKGSKM
jgi:hypothetical protein